MTDSLHARSQGTATPTEDPFSRICGLAMSQNLHFLHLLSCIMIHLLQAEVKNNQVQREIEVLMKQSASDRPF